MDSLSITTLFALIIGVIFSVGGIILLIIAKQNSFRCNEATTGIIVDVIEEDNLYYSEYEFEVNGKIYRKKRKNGNIECMEEIDDEILVFYNIDNPEDCFAEGEKSNTGIPIALILTGVFSLIMYFLVL